MELTNGKVPEHEANYLTALMKCPPKVVILYFCQQGQIHQSEYRIISEGMGTSTQAKQSCKKWASRILEIPVDTTKSFLPLDNCKR